MAPDTDSQPSSPEALHGTPFGEQNRRRLIAQYFGEKGAQQRAIYPGRDFPMPGADPEIERIIGEALKPFLASKPPAEIFDAVADRLREYWKQENKRKNLLGEGFEDVLAAVVNAACGPE